MRKMLVKAEFLGWNVPNAEAQVRLFRPGRPHDDKVVVMKVAVTGFEPVSTLAPDERVAAKTAVARAAGREAGGLSPRQEIGYT